MRLETRVLKLFMVVGLVVSCSEEPEDYEDCILRHVKSGMTKGAVAAVASACREKFPEVLQENELIPAGNQPLPSSSTDTVESSDTGGIFDDAFEKLQVDRPALQALPPEALRSLKGRLGHSHGSSWRGTLYNGSESWLVKSFVIGIGPKEAEPSELQRYWLDISLPPLESRDFSLKMNWEPSEADFGWFILSAKGERVLGK